MAGKRGGGKEDFQSEASETCVEERKTTGEERERERERKRGRLTSGVFAFLAVGALIAADRRVSKRRT